VGPRGGTGRGGEGGLSPKRLVGDEQLGGGRTAVLWLWWNFGERRRPPSGSVARGGEGKAEVGLARGSNGGAGGAHYEDELVVDFRRLTVDEM
jgi:hypothetical protein